MIVGADACAFLAHMPTASIHLPISADNKTPARQAMVAGKIFYVCVVLTPPYLAAPGHTTATAPLHNFTSRRRQEI